jgi:hypothetical protein
MLAVLDAQAAAYYVVLAAAGLLVAAVRLRKSPWRVVWWEWLALALPLAVWAGMWNIPLFVEGRKSLTNFGEPALLGLVVGLLGVIVRWLGASRLPRGRIRPAFILATCVAAVTVVLFVPILPE